jgi:hypothetical protein
MSIDFLMDLERAIDSGRDVYACPGVGNKQWVISKSIEDLKKIAKRAAENKKRSIDVVKLISKHDAIVGSMYLVPTQIDEPGARGEPQIKWDIMETKEAADQLRDLKFGQSPYFAMEVVDTVSPSSA